MEIGSVILSQFAPKIIGTFAIKYFSNILPKWILKKYPYEKDKLIVFVDLPRINNRDDFKKLNFSISIKNFNYANIIIEKIKIEIIKDSTGIHDFERSFTETELQSNYNWSIDLTDALVNRYFKYFIQFPELDKFFISKGEFDFRIKIYYSYLDKKGSSEYNLRSAIEMDCRTF